MKPAKIKQETNSIFSVLILLVGLAIIGIISEGYFTLLSEVEGRVKEFYVMEGDYVEVDSALIEVELAEED